MIAQRQPPRWDVEDYLAMERTSPVKHEFLDGYVYAMAGGTQRHSRICVNLTTLLAVGLRGGPCRAFNSDMKVRIDARRYVYPDASVGCDPRDLDHEDAVFLGHPRLVAEVLSDDSTAAYDRGDKFDLLYAQLESLREYMLVETSTFGAEVRRRQPDGSWATVRYGPHDTVALESLAVSFPIADLYL